LKEGRLVESGRVQKVFDTPTQEYTRKLLNAVPGKRLFLSDTAGQSAANPDH